jgi:dipeptide transport system permease protein
LKTQATVWSEFKVLFPATLELAIVALLFALVVGMVAGVIAAVKRGTFADHGVMTIALAGYSMPIFWWGLLLILVFSVGLGWTPVSGRLDLVFDVPPQSGFMLIDAWRAELADPIANKGAFWDAVRHLILPAVVLGTIPLAVIARMTRSSMLEVLREDYVRTARAKGLSPARVVFVHALRNALIPVLTVIGLQVGTLMGGAVLTETIFSWPGIGKWLIDAIGRRDYPVVQNGILLIATLVILTNFLVDILYGVANPRILHQR